MINRSAILNNNDRKKNSANLTRNSPLSFANVAYEGSTGSLVESNSTIKMLDNVYLSWRSLSVKVSNGCSCNKNGKGRKVIFENADGLVKPGEMLALMGASGAGKTTLLNVLNYRGTGNLQIEGEILINGSTASSEKISMISSYIQQDYLFFGTLTG
jgi:ABC-type multidrug transport system fused ATPase/permease subunit